MPSPITVTGPCTLSSYGSPNVFVPAVNTGGNSEQVIARIDTTIPVTGRRPVYVATARIAIGPRTLASASGYPVPWSPPNPPPVATFAISGTLTDESFQVIPIPATTFIV